MKALQKYEKIETSVDSNCLVYAYWKYILILCNQMFGCTLHQWWYDVQNMEWVLCWKSKGASIKAHEVNN